MNNAMNSTISEAAELIASYNPRLAALWRSQPFQRVNLALAFAAGFKQARTPDSDPHPHALLVLRVAHLDRDMRAAA